MFDQEVPERDTTKPLLAIRDRIEDRGVEVVSIVGAGWRLIDDVANI